jgi:peptidoglycan/LPS O-acetylase OafA/YrhL
MSTLTNKFDRQDITGLRAIAITFVLAYHIFPRISPGGFFGVDIFFVISGYLIWKISTRRAISGNFSVIDFYSKRIIRLSPALIVVLLATSLLGAITLLSYDFARLGNQVFSASLYLSNILYYSESGYFDTAALQKPLLNLWSLGVEANFYLLFPILLYYLTKLKHRILTTTVLLVLCLIGHTALKASDDRAAFFLIIGRMWQFLAGVLAALIEDHVSKNSAREFTEKSHSRQNKFWILLSLGSFLGMMGISILINSNNSALTYWTALITFLTATFIYFSGKTGGAYLVKFTWITFLGKISYPLYLWHWPILYFVKIFYPDNSSISIGIITLFTAIAFAVLTYFFVEKPYQSWGGRRPRAAAAALLAALAFTALLGQIINLRYFGSNLSKTESVLSSALNDWATPVGGLKDSELKINHIKGNGISATLFLGDSHMEQYWPRIEKLILSSQNKSADAYFLAWGGCPPFPETKELKSSRNCDIFVRKAFEFAQDKFVKTVVLNAYWEWYFFGTLDRPETNQAKLIAKDSQNGEALKFGTPEAELAFQRLEDEIRRLIRNGKVVVLVLSSPAGSRNDPKTMLRDLKRDGKIDPQNYGVDRQAFVEFSLPISQKLKDMAERTGATVIDPVESLCEESKCLSMYSGAPIYRDDDHLRPFYVRDHLFYLDSTVSTAASSPR